MSNLIKAVNDVLREALDAVDVHPCDVHNDSVRAKHLNGAMAALYVAAAAPQVVADERAAFEAYLDSKNKYGLTNRDTFDAEYLAFMWKGWSELAAQVQEQWVDKLTYDAQVDEWAIEKSNLEREIEELKSCAPVQAQEPVAWSYECKQPLTDPAVWCEFINRDRPSSASHVRNIKPLYPAPVQPVAVPDCWRAAIDGLMDFAPTNEGPLPGMIRGGNWLRKHDVIEALSNIAAPAAQGDAKATMKQVCTNCAGEGRFYKTVMTSFGGGEREETVCKVCVGSGVIYSAIAAKAAS